MPVKTRRPKRRTSDLEGWSMLFETGHDYFHDLGFGCAGPDRATIRAAWQRLGAQFLAMRGDDALQRRPWALMTFGEPPCR